MKKDLVSSVISSFLVLLFAYAAFSKLFDYSTFRVQLGKSPFIGHFSGLIAWALPLVEFAVVYMLLRSKTRMSGLYVALFLMWMFTCYIYFITRFSYYIPCSCGGILAAMSWGTHLIFNLAVDVLTMIAILSAPVRPNLRGKDAPAEYHPMRGSEKSLEFGAL